MARGDAKSSGHEGDGQVVHSQHDDGQQIDDTRVLTTKDWHALNVHGERYGLS